MPVGGTRGPIPARSTPALPQANEVSHEEPGSPSVPAPARRRAVAGVVVAALPLVANVSATNGLHYAAVWSAYVPGWTSNVIVDVALYATCFFSPLNSVVCGALALV